jgi:signal transduction histidine kinase
MIRQLVRSYVLLVAVAIALFTVPVAFTLTDQLRDDTKASVLREADAMALLLGNDESAACEALEEVANAYEDEIQVTATAGCTADLPRPTADEALTRALRSGESSVDWGSDFIWGDHLVVTVPAHEVLVLGVAAVIGVVVARRLTRPLRQLNDMASKFSDGDLTARSPVTGPQETQTLARTLNQGAERLDTLIASQRIFVADASHQLRTPLTALRLSLDNIADGVDDEFVKEDVEQATAEVVRMSRLVNGLLVLARAEAKVTAAEPLALWDIVQERLAVWRPAADERGVTIALRGSADGRLLVLTSPGHMEQVLDNVLSNALEVSPDGGTITVRVEPRGDEVVLSVDDEGPGMPDTDKSRAFDRFWRGRGLTGRTGSGLGLSVVKQLVTDDGGTVALDDAPGGGLSVRISLRASSRSGG